MQLTSPENYVQTMSDVRRAKFLKVWDGYEPVHLVTNALYYIYSHFPENKIDPALDWLIRNKKTGTQFVAFWYECGGSVLALHKKMLTILDKDKKLRIVAGRNFRQ